jgi:hypothetical protein
VATDSDLPTPHTGAAAGSANTATVKIDPTPPTISISAPADGASYLQHTSVTASYSCADEAGGSGLASCLGTVATGAKLDTSTPGTHAFTVTAADHAGNVAGRTVHYNVRACTLTLPLGLPLPIDLGLISICIV